MKIALSGYGKMGKIIERLGSNYHAFPLKINAENINEFKIDKLDEIDVVIDFSTSETAFDNIKTALQAGKPVVSGTTGWNERRHEIENICKEATRCFFVLF